MVGLLAARVLSEFYEAVTVVERDRLPNRATHRRGVPQGRHFHNLSSRGAHVLAELFPGLLDELAAAGAVVHDGDLSRVYARVGRYEFKRSGTLADPAALVFCLATRPFLEFHVRRRVMDLPNVTVLDGHEVVEPIGAAAAITGVRVVDRDNGVAAALDADVVVDAMGRAARTPAFLEGLGCRRPTETRSATRVGYSSQRLRIPTGRIREQVVASRVTQCAVLLVACEQDSWMLAVGRPIDAGGAPSDVATMLAMAEDLLPPEIMGGLRSSQPLEQIAVFHNPAAVWRRYEQMPRFPRGLLVMGDALCSLNPIYGQGMTMAALQVLTLRDCLRGGDADLAQRFFCAADAYLASTWAANRASDRVLSPPREQSMPQKLRHRIAGAALNAAAHDTAVAERFLRVTNLIDPPARLQDPRLLPRILAANVRDRRAQPPAQAGDQRVQQRGALPGEYGIETGSADHGRTSRHDG
jgi:2-polyprenyl-6-methoxyphenol hydroxylase-like FAD-dependent oxidoreductase